MKKPIKIIAVLLCACLSFSLVACGGGGDNATDAGTPKPTGTVTQTEELKGKEGLHKITVTPTDNVFVRADGSTDYTVLYPKDCHARVPAIAATFARNIGLATDASVPFKQESDESWSEDAKYVVIGDCDLFAAAGLTMPEENLGQTGVYIKTVGKSVFINANYWLGLNNGTFVFLEHVLGHSQVYDTSVFHIEKGKDVNLPAIEIIEAPDFEFADFTTNFGEDNGFANRLSNFDMFMELEGSGDTVWHNSFNWVNLEARRAHEKWVSEDGSQLCYTAHGDAAEYQAMLEHCVDFVLPSIRKHPDKNNVTFTHQDETTWCTCETCTKYFDAYGTDSAVLILFMKRLSKMINDEVQKTQPERKITLWFFAYHATEHAPVVKNAEGKYVPIEPQFTGDKTIFVEDESLVCDDTVGVYIAPINTRYTHKLTDAENEYMYESVMGWDGVVPVKGAWLYSANFYHLYYPYNCFDSIPTNIRLFRNLGTRWIWNQGQGYGMTGFGALKEYLNFKLYWNCNLDISALRQSFFDDYYGPASDVMYTMYTEIVAHCRYIEDQFAEISGGLYENLEQAAMWPKGLLERWEGYCDEALEKVRSAADLDEAYRQALIKNVTGESMFPRFALIRLHKTSYSRETIKQMQREWKADAQKYSFVCHQEHYTIEDVFQSWDVD